MSFTHKKKYIIASLVALSLVAGIFWYSSNSRNQLIVDYDYQRDSAAIAQIFDTDWDWLIPFAKDDYSLDLVLKYKAPQQNPLYAGRLNIKVARIDDRLIGFVMYYLKKPGEWFFNFLDVIPAYRGKGYASKLARYAIDDMIAKGAQRITLVTYPHNESALKLYKKLGFVEISRGRQVELQLKV